MKCAEIIDKLLKLAPLEYACDWDNPGLLAGSRLNVVKKIYIALDATDKVVEEAIANNADMLVTHHPLIFKPVKKVNDEDFISRRIMKLIKNDISYFAMHTNFDSAPGCMADLAAGKLNLRNAVPLEVMGEAGDILYGIGKSGILEEPLTLRELAELVKEKFGLPGITVYGADEYNEKVSRAAISPGAGGSMISFAMDAGSQVLITGDISHHEGIDAFANGLVIMDAGHYGLEHIFVDFIDEFIKRKFGNEIETITEPVSFPAKIW